jgi:hypothetical protein
VRNNPRSVGYLRVGNNISSVGYSGWKHLKICLMFRVKTTQGLLDIQGEKYAECYGNPEE